MTLEIAVAFGHVHIVEELAKRALEQNLENQANGYETTMTEAVLVAFRCGKLEMARTLFSALIGHPLRNLMIENGSNAIYTKNFGIAFELINRFPSLVDARDSEGNTPLMTLASIPDAFPSRNRIVFWKGWIYKYCISVDHFDLQTRSWDAKVRAPFCYLSSDILRYLGDASSIKSTFLPPIPKHDNSENLVLRVSYDNNIATIRAIKNGILEFVDMCLWLINVYSFSWIADEKSQNVLFLAVLHRQHEIFNRISRDDGLKEDLACQKDDDGNTLLHMAGMPPDFIKLNRIQAQPCRCKENYSGLR
ncbi:hypothetical protein CJ030_MR1G015686 [Morella rubra]|uniref:Uncharacterized protein n=1 Tax=Morella rubra TaxID=262757 RepID=A0A6A1WJS0_9ROSI|nr:hypothetical protein CJ030_MR1G015686 [Morella rubra]